MSVSPSVGDAKTAGIIARQADHANTLGVECVVDADCARIRGLPTPIVKYEKLGIKRNACKRNGGVADVL